MKRIISLSRPPRRRLPRLAITTFRREVARRKNLPNRLSRKCLSQTSSRCSASCRIAAPANMEPRWRITFPVPSKPIPLRNNARGMSRGKRRDVAPWANKENTKIAPQGQTEDQHLCALRQRAEAGEKEAGSARNGHQPIAILLPPHKTILDCRFPTTLRTTAVRPLQFSLLRRPLPPPRNC